MKSAVTSKEEILAVCRDLIHGQSGAALNVREVAAACGISVGTIYNYFGSKSELVEAAVESVWYDIFRCEDKEPAFGTTQDCLCWLLDRLAYGNKQYPGFFLLHSIRFAHDDRDGGKQRMEKVWARIIDLLQRVIRQDPLVQPQVFDADFTPKQFADLLFSLLLAAQLRGQYDATPALQLVRRLLY